MAPPPPVAPRRPQRKRGALKFVASTCIFSAWLTLVVALLFAGASLMAGLGLSAQGAAARSGPQYFPAPTAPGMGDGGLEGGGGLGVEGLPGLGGGGSPLGGGGNPLGGLANALDLRGYMAAALYGSALFNFVTGIVGFFLFLGLGQACYALLDLDEESQRQLQMLEIIAARLGAGR